MGAKTALSEGEVQSTNLKSIRNWIRSNAGRIKAKPNKTVVYAGLSLDVVKALSPADRDVLQVTPMYERIRQQQKSKPKDLEVPVDFEMLSDVLGRLRDHPELVDKDRQPRHFASAQEFFESIKDMGTLLPDPKRLQKEFDQQLSEIYVSNAEGDLKIMDGVGEDYGRLEQFKILLKAELPKLLKTNDKLSAAGKKELLRVVTQYGDEFDRRYRNFLRSLQTSVGELKQAKRR